MSSHSRSIRRPSASMLVASAALFMSLGGVGYAATQIPNNSVGTAQLQHHSVTGGKIDFLSVGFRKIQLGAVGRKRINTNQVQERVGGTCAGNSAVASIDNQGNTQCNPTGSRELSTSAPFTPLSMNTPIQTLKLAGGSSYVVLANPQVNVAATAPGSQVEVDCTLSVSPAPGATQTRSVTFAAGTHDPQSAALSLIVPAPATPGGSSASVACSRTATGGMPTATVGTSISALQTASNG